MTTRREILNAMMHGHDKWKVYSIPEYSAYFQHVTSQTNIETFRDFDQGAEFLTPVEVEKFTIPVRTVSKHLSPEEVIAQAEQRGKMTRLGMVDPIVVSCRIGIDMKHGVIGWDDGDGCISINEAIECILRGEAKEEVRAEVTMEEKNKFANEKVAAAAVQWDEDLWDHVKNRVKSWFTRT